MERKDAAAHVVICRALEELLIRGDVDADLALSRTLVGGAEIRAPLRPVAVVVARGIDADAEEEVAEPLVRTSADAPLQTRCAGADAHLIHETAVGAELRRELLVDRGPRPGSVGVVVAGRQGMTFERSVGLFERVCQRVRILHARARELHAQRVARRDAGVAVGGNDHVLVAVALTRRNQSADRGRRPELAAITTNRATIMARVDFRISVVIVRSSLRAPARSAVPARRARHRSTSHR